MFHPSQPASAPSPRARKTRARWSTIRDRGFPARLFLQLCLGVCLGWASNLAAHADEPSLILATTTSVRDSGLLDELLPIFQEETGIEVRVIAVGTGAALRMGREGNADVLLTHAPSAEQVLVDEGIVRQRTPFMENFFVIAGPEEDPARIADEPTPEAAIQKIARQEQAWVSRDDDSGTHKREKQLFGAAGLDPSIDWKGLVKTGSGMGLSLQVAGERRAYILSDIGTFLAFEKRIDLKALSQPAPSLKNVYSVLQLDGERFERPIQFEQASRLEAFLVSAPAQAQIAEFGQDRFGRALFTPLFREPSSNESAKHEKKPGPPGESSNAVLRR